MRAHHVADDHAVHRDRNGKDRGVEERKPAEPPYAKRLEHHEQRGRDLVNGGERRYLHDQVILRDPGPGCALVGRAPGQKVQRMRQDIDHRLQRTSPRRAGCPEDSPISVRPMLPQMPRLSAARGVSFTLFRPASARRIPSTMRSQTSRVASGVTIAHRQARCLRSSRPGRPAPHGVLAALQ